MSKQEMARNGLQIPDVTLITEEIAVDYQVVEKEIPKLWEKYKPKVWTSNSVW